MGMGMGAPRLSWDEAGMDPGGQFHLSPELSGVQGRGRAAQEKSPLFSNQILYQSFNSQPKGSFFRTNDGQISTCFQCQLDLKGSCQQSETSNIGKVAIFLEVSHPSLCWIFFLQTPNLKALTSKNTSPGKVLLLPTGVKTQPSPTLEETFTLDNPVSFVFKVIFAAAGAQGSSVHYLLIFDPLFPSQTFYFFLFSAEIVLHLLFS